MRATPSGGVSALPQGPALRHFKPDADEAAPVATAGGAARASFPGFKHHGGPIVASALVHASFWGKAWKSDQVHIRQARRLNRFIRDLLASNYMNILSQYGAGEGAGKAGRFAGTSFMSNVAGQLRDADIRRILQSAVNAGTLPEPGKPARDVVMIYLAEGIEVRGPGPARLCEPKGENAFGYHSSFKTRARNPFYYAVIPALDDACIQSTCGGGECSLRVTQTQEQRRTQISSHEFAEMVTDPDVGGWYDARSHSENGDICNGQPATIKVGSRTWTVQRIYSKHDDVRSGGSRYCITSAPRPIPRL